MSQKIQGAFCKFGNYAAMIAGFITLTSQAAFANPPLEFKGEFFGGPSSRDVKCEWYFSNFVHKTVHYCTERSRPDLPKKSGEPVVYFFHSLTGDENSWVKHGYSDMLSKLRKKQNLPAMTIVTFSTETYSMFSDFAGNPTGSRAYESWFIHDFIPMIEDKFDLCRERACRALAGLSMGGFGAIKTAIRYWNMFFMAAGNSPALPPFSPWEPLSKWTDYFSHTKVGPLLGMPLVLQGRRIFPSDSYANNNDPAFLVDAFGDATKLPYLYFDMGGNDDFGFNVGYAKLVEVLNRRGVKYSSEFVPDGTHELFKTRGEQLLRIVADGIAGRL